MPKTRKQKEEVVEKLKQNFEKQRAIYLIDFQKSKAKDFFDLRRKLKDINALLYVAKKRLIKVALKDKKIPIKINDLKGQIALVFGFKDELAPAKIIYDFEKEYNCPKILGGYLENEFIEREKVIELAKLPSKEELLVRLIGSLNSPTSRLVNTLGNNIKGLLVTLKKISKQ